MGTRFSGSHSNFSKRIICEQNGIPNFGVTSPLQLSGKYSLYLQAVKYYCLKFSYFA